MTEQEKAKELVQIYFDLTDHMNWGQAKQCALICCDEIISEWQNANGGTKEQRAQIIHSLYFWRNVKSEIEKL